MSYRADKQVIDTHTDTRTHRHTDAGGDNTRRPKLALGKNGLSIIWRQAIIWTNDDILSIRPYETHFGQILFEIQNFYSRKCI